MTGVGLSAISNRNKKSLRCKKACLECGSSSSDEMSSSQNEHKNSVSAHHEVMYSLFAGIKVLRPRSRVAWSLWYENSRILSSSRSRLLL